MTRLTNRPRNERRKEQRERAKSDINVKDRIDRELFDRVPVRRFTSEQLLDPRVDNIIFEQIDQVHSR